MSCQVQPGLTELGHQHAAEDGSAAAAQAVVDALQHALRGRAHVRRGVVRYVRATGCPHGGVRDALHELEGQHPPGVSQPRDVEEAQDVADQAEAQNLRQISKRYSVTR